MGCVYYPIFGGNPLRFRHHCIATKIWKMQSQDPQGFTNNQWLAPWSTTEIQVAVGELGRCFLLSTGVSKNAKHLQVDMDKDSVFSSNVSWIFGRNLGLICWEAIFVWRWHGRLEKIIFMNMNFWYYWYYCTNLPTNQTRSTQIEGCVQIWAVAGF